MRLIMLIMTCTITCFFDFYGDNNEVLGQAVAFVYARHPRDREGAYLKLKIFGSNSSWYQWYIENEGAKGRISSNVMHHMCRRALSSCMRFTGRTDYIHVQKWAPLSKSDANAVLRRWGFPGIQLDLLPRRNSQHSGTAPKTRAHSPHAAGVGALGDAPKQDEDVEDADEEADPEPVLDRAQEGKEAF